MITANIVVMGKTGTGKSTLINAVLGREAAPTGKGQAITRENQVYEMFREYDSGRKKVRLRLYDTVGLEIDAKLTRETLVQIRQLIKDAQAKCASETGPEDVAIVWFCVNEQSSRFESYETELIRELSYDYEIPFACVLTQCMQTGVGELEAQIRRDLPEVTIIKVLAKDYVLFGGQKIEAFGVESLLSQSIEDFSHKKIKVLEGKQDYLHERIASAVKKKRIPEATRRKCGSIIADYSERAGRAAIIPALCIPGIHALCIRMVSDLNRCVGLTADAETALANMVFGLAVTPTFAVPGLSILAAKAYIEVVGEGYRDTLISVYDSATDAEIADDEKMLQRIKEELGRRKA